MSVNKKAVDVKLTGEVSDAGRVSGKGTLTLTFADAGRSDLSLVKLRGGGTELRVEHVADLRLRKSSTLTLRGMLFKNLETSPVEGEFGLKLKLPKGIDFSISHEFQPGADQTSMKLTIRF